MLWYESGVFREGIFGCGAEGVAVPRTIDHEIPNFVLLLFIEDHRLCWAVGDCSEDFARGALCILIKIPMMLA